MIKDIGFCGHCGQTATRTIIHEGFFIARWNNLPERCEGAPTGGRYFVTVCGACSDVSVWRAVSYDSWDVAASDPLWLAYPSNPVSHSAVPDTVRRCYSEASAVEPKSPSAYATMLRRALEAICDERKVPKGSLNTRLNKLLGRSEFSSVIVKMAHLLRGMGNLGVHETTIAPPTTLTELMDKSFGSILYFIYIAPSEIASFETEFAAHMEHWKGSKKSSDLGSRLKRALEASKAREEE